MIKVVSWAKLRSRLTLRVKGYSAMLELVEGSIIILIDRDELLFKSFKLVFILLIFLHALVQLGFKLVQICCSSLDVFLSLKQENLLLLIMRFDLLCQCILSVFQHFYEDLKLLMQL